MDNFLVDTFYADLEKVIGLISKNEIEARVIFNRDIYPRYKDAINDDKSSLRPLAFFFFELDEFLNNQNARLLGQSTKKEILGSFYSDFLGDLDEARKIEKGAR